MSARWRWSSTPSSTAACDLWYLDFLNHVVEFRYQNPLTLVVEFHYQNLLNHVVAVIRYHEVYDKLRVVHLITFPSVQM